VTPTRQAIVGGVVPLLLDAEPLLLDDELLLLELPLLGGETVGGATLARAGAAAALSADGPPPPQPLNPKTMRAISAQSSTATMSALRSATQKLSETAVRVGLSMRAAAGMLSTEPIVLSRDSAGAGL
jgi:hypothetical protein